jgi:hypothetical protein
MGSQIYTRLPPREGVWPVWRACLRVYAQPGAPEGGCHQLSSETAPLTYLLRSCAHVRMPGDRAGGRTDRRYCKPKIHRI